MLIQRGDLVPHFQATTDAGRLVVYAAEIWQRRNLLLVLLPAAAADAGADGYAAAVAARHDELSAHACAVVVTRDALAGLPNPGVVIADRWGEVYFAAAAGTAGGLPGVGELADWLHYIAQECPECGGEAR